MGAWAKCSSDTSDYHALLAHAADVASVIGALLDLPQYRRIYLHLSNGSKIDDALRDFFSAMAGLHDFGKDTSGFQSKKHGHIYPLGAIVASQAFLNSLIYAFPWLGENEEALSYLECACSHHGKYPGALADNKFHRKQEYEKLWLEKYEGQSGYDRLKEHGAYLLKLFPRSLEAKIPENIELQHFFLGLLIMADWIASDPSFFPWIQNVTEDYFDISRKRAHEALKKIGMDIQEIRSNATYPANFENQFNYTPHPMQRAIDNLSLDPEGSLVILEAETGSGKTECALRYFTRLHEAGLVDSLYFANPLRFAATQLHQRVSNNIGRIFKGKMPTVLAVPGYLAVDNYRGLRLPDYKVLWSDEENDAGRNWAAEHPKRYTCAPCAVGTIDQALLSILSAPHSHLRAVGLMRSLLVIDEVHASDAYMTRLNEELVSLMGRGGGHVLMLSATLGGTTRERYLNIFRRERTKKQSVSLQERKKQKKKTELDLKDCIVTPYPLLSTPDEQIEQIEIPTRKQNTKTTKKIEIKLLNIINNPKGIARLALNAAREGACVLVLRNSIFWANETLKALESLTEENEKHLIFKVNGISTLHHSRFAPPDRKHLDQEIESLAGKHGEKRRPCVVVSTQTLEQSLDVDFDFLITDLCPMDVWLQRIGRLFRHLRVRPAGYEIPRCVILTPDNFDWLLSREALKYQYGVERAYEDVRSVLATWNLLGSRTFVQIPEDNRELVERATHPDCLEELAAKMGTEWMAHGAKIDGIRVANCQSAGYGVVDWSEYYNERYSRDYHVSTRLGVSDVVIEFASPMTSPFGCRVEKMIVPRWMTERDCIESKCIVHAHQRNEGFEFSFLDRSYTYDRYGLQQQGR